MYAPEFITVFSIQSPRPHSLKQGPTMYPSPTGPYVCIYSWKLLFTIISNNLYSLLITVAKRKGEECEVRIDYIASNG